MTTNETIDTNAVQVTAQDAHLNTQMRQAKLLSDSTFLPQHYQGKPADCLVAIQWAQRSGRDPLELLQNSYVVHGTPALKTSYMIALVNRSGPFDGPIRFEVHGSGADLYAVAYGLIDGERYEATASMEMAKTERWTKNPKYGSMPEHMLKWRAATFLIRLYAPEALLGMSTVDEAQDMHHALEPKRLPNALEALNDRARGATEIVEPTAEPEPEAQESLAEEPEGEVAGEEWQVGDAGGAPF